MAPRCSMSIVVLVVLTALCALTHAQLQPFRCLNGISSNTPQPVGVTAFGVCGSNVLLDNKTTNFLWDLGDGSPEVVVNGATGFIHVYSAPGIYSISASAINRADGTVLGTSVSQARTYDCFSQTTNSILSQVNPAGSLSVLTACVVPYERDTTLFFQWDYGDNSVSSPSDPKLVVVQHAFPSTGTFDVVCKVTKVTDNGPVSFTIQQQVSVTKGSGATGGGDGLSGGAIAGIVIGSVVGTFFILSLIITSILWFLLLRRKANAVTGTKYVLMDNMNKDGAGASEELKS